MRWARMSEKKTPSRLSQLARHLGDREGLGWIKRQRPRWLLKTAREDRRGPADRGTLSPDLRIPQAPAATARVFAPSSCSSRGSPLWGADFLG